MIKICKDCGHPPFTHSCGKKCVHKTIRTLPCPCETYVEQTFDNLDAISKEKDSIETYEEQYEKERTAAQQPEISRLDATAEYVSKYNTHEKLMKRSKKAFLENLCNFAERVENHEGVLFGISTDVDKKPTYLFFE